MLHQRSSVVANSTQFIIVASPCCINLHQETLLPAGGGGGTKDSMKMHHFSKQASFPIRAASFGISVRGHNIGNGHQNYSVCNSLPLWHVVATDHRKNLDNKGLKEDGSKTE